MRALEGTRLTNGHLYKTFENLPKTLLYQPTNLPIIFEHQLPMIQPTNALTKEQLLLEYINKKPP